MELESPSKFKLSITGVTRYGRAFKFCAIVFVFVVLLLLVCSYFVFKHGRADNALIISYFTVVVDCGSTGTRVNVYEWKKSGVENENLPVLAGSYPDNSTKSLLLKTSCEYHCLQTEPGLDKFVGNTSGVRASLEPLVLLAEQLVPLERHRDTPISVFATAGLRSLPTEDARRVLDDVEGVVKEHSFVYRKNSIRVLSGEEEAYYGWLALNYRMGTLGNSSRTPTFGLLDLGGSSLQAVMEKNNRRDDKHLIKSDIGSTEHQISAYSLPAYGLNEAFDRTVAMLGQERILEESSGGRLETKHPCLSSDFAQNYTCYSCGGLNNTVMKKLSGQQQKTGFTTNLVGDPNWEKCKGLARAIAINSSNLDWSKPTVGGNCKTSFSSSSGKSILNTSDTTHSSGRFHALSGFFVVYNNLNLSSPANLTKIWEKGKHLCSRLWSDLSKGAGNQNYARQSCFRVPYIASLLEEALCLGKDEIIFGPGDISWTLGAALVEGGNLGLNNAETRTAFPTLKDTEVISSSIFLFILLIFLLFIVYYSQIKLPMPGRKVPAVGTPLPSYMHPKRRPNILGSAE